METGPNLGVLAVFPSIEGMEPDVALDWDGDSRTERTRKVLAALTELFMEEAGGVDHRSTFPP